ncbi:hypothetical protein GHT09_000180 [Marmota monax]|uniref:Uncharacterized protein n=1 Tax=Marmota monax TaxID=9995 RepID=A0A834PZ11_MARMO|nr:hypothetical protein GHT09_000180 [Marmota monax]
MSYPFLLHAQACGSTSAVTKFTQRTVFLEKTSGILSGPAQYAQVGKRALVLTGSRAPGSFSMAHQPPRPPLVRRPHLGMVGAGPRCSVASGQVDCNRWESGVRHHCVSVRSLAVGLKEKTINWISPIINPLFLSPAPAVVNFSALQILSSEKVSSVSVQREGTFLGPSALLSKPVCLRSSTLRTAGPAGNPECGKDLLKGSQICELSQSRP